MVLKNNEYNVGLQKRCYKSNESDVDIQERLNKNKVIDVMSIQCVYKRQNCIGNIQYQYFKIISTDVCPVLSKVRACEISITIRDF